MTIGELIDIIQEDIPESSALEWDNVGLLVGGRGGQLHGVYLAVDATDAVIREAVQAGCELLLTHHPLIFGGCRRVTEDDIVGRRVIALIEHGMSLYAMHTSFDVERMGSLAAQRLGLKDPMTLDVTQPDNGGKGIGCVAKIREASLAKVAAQAREAFAVSSVRVFGDADKPVRVLAVSPGSGKSEVAAALRAGADALITGDIDHHTGIDAAAAGLAVIDAGHYGVEYLYVEYMQQFLKEHAPRLSVVCEKKQEPFWQI